MRSVINLLSQLDTTTNQVAEGDCNSRYWVDVNASLNKGYELPAYSQNILDDINQTLTEQFRSQTIDVKSITQEDFENLVQSIDLTNLGQFIGYRGIDHHYHVLMGMYDRTFKLDVDLKCIPTSIGQFNNVVASICFISGKLTVCERVYHDVCIKYIGPDILKDYHSSVIKHGKIATNSQLGKWLLWVRTFNYDDVLKSIK